MPQIDLINHFYRYGGYKDTFELEQDEQTNFFGILKGGGVITSMMGVINANQIYALLFNNLNINLQRKDYFAQFSLLMAIDPIKNNQLDKELTVLQTYQNYRTQILLEKQLSQDLPTWEKTLQHTGIYFSGFESLLKKIKKDPKVQDYEKEIYQRVYKKNLTLIEKLYKEGLPLLKSDNPKKEKNFLEMLGIKGWEL